MSFLRLSIALFLLASTAIAAPRLAIIASPENADAAALLTSTLSSSGNVDVIERSELANIAREKGLMNMSPDPSEYTRIGQLLGANALVVLESPEKGKSLSARLVSVDAGVIVDEQSSPWPMEDTAGWAKFLARRFGEAINNIPTQPGSKILLGLLGIRSATTGYSAGKVEKEISFLLSKSLTHLPGVFVLERARLRDTDWEKQLAAQAASRYWTSSWLLDGNILHEGAKITFDGRLRVATGSGSQAFRVEGSDPKTLSDAITKSVAAILKLGLPTTQEASASEAAEFQAEAEWGLRWKLYEQAERAANASWALGNKTEAMGILRARIPAEKANAANRYTVNNNDVFGKLPDPESLEDITRALGNFLEIPIKSPNDPGSPTLNETAADIIEYASEILQSYYYQPFPRTPEEDNKLRWIRAQVRDLTPSVLRGGEAMLKTLDKIDYNNSIRDTQKFPARFYLTQALYAPLWGDTPEQSEEQLLASRKAIHAASHVMQHSVKEWGYMERTIHAPLITAWAIKDRSRVAPLREKLLQKMGSSPDPKDRLDAAILQIVRYNFLNHRKLQKMVPIEKRRESFAIFERLLWDIRDDLVKGRIDPRLYAYAFGKFALSETYQKEIGHDFRKFQKQLLSYLLEQKWPGDEAVYGALLQRDILTPTERDSLIALLPALQAAYPKRKSLIRFLEFRIPDSTVGTKAELPPGPSDIAHLKPTRVFRFEDADSPVRVDSAMGRNNTFTLNYAPAHSQKIKVLEINTATGKQQDYVIGDRTTFKGSYFTASEEFFFLYGWEKLTRVTKATGSVEIRTIPMLGQYATDMWYVSGKLWAANQGTIVRIDPQTLDSELIASAQRRPGQTILDDREPYSVSTIFPDRAGNTWVLVDNKGSDFYRWNESRRNFETVETPKIRNGFQFDRSLHLKRVEYDNSRRRGDGEFPLLLDKNREGKVYYAGPKWDKYQLPGMESFQNLIFGYAAVGSRLYATYEGKGDVYLRVMDDEQGKTFSIPIDVPQGPESPDSMIANDAGILLYDQTVHELLFFSKEDIDKFAATKAL